MLALAEIAYWKMRTELLVAGQGWQMHWELGRQKRGLGNGGWNLSPELGNEVAQVAGILEGEGLQWSLLILWDKEPQ